MYTLKRFQGFKETISSTEQTAGFTATIFLKELMNENDRGVCPVF
jgi:hypothetical protein